MAIGMSRLKTKESEDHFIFTVVDVEEDLEYTPGVLLAFAKPSHLDALTFTLQPVRHKLGCNFAWGMGEEAGRRQHDGPDQAHLRRRGGRGEDADENHRYDYRHDF